MNFHFVVLLMSIAALIAEGQVFTVNAYYPGTQCRCPYVGPASSNLTEPDGTPCNEADGASFLCVNASGFVDGQCYFCRGGALLGGFFNLTTLGQNETMFCWGANCHDTTETLVVSIGTCTPTDHGLDVIIAVANVPPASTIDITRAPPLDSVANHLVWSSYLMSLVLAILPVTLWAKWI